eukprot:8127321-Heterocapsa_arctica.AAC.1
MTSSGDPPCLKNQGANEQRRTRSRTRPGPPPPGPKPPRRRFSRDRWPSSSALIPTTSSTSGLDM